MYSGILLHLLLHSLDDKVFEASERQTIVDQVDEPWCQISPQQLGEAVGHQPSPRHLAQHTETQSHRRVQMSTYREKQEMEETEDRKEEDRGKVIILQIICSHIACQLIDT